VSRLAVIEVAGRDSVAAAIAAVRGHGFDTLLPTMAFTGTETGDFEAPERAIGRLRAIVGDSVEVLEPVKLRDSNLWSALNARFAAPIRDRFGVYSACLACHLYLHLLRAPVAWEHDNAPIVAGERDTHDGRLKLSQTAPGIDAAIRVLAHGGLKLLEPVRYLSGTQVADLVGGGWEQERGQLGCMLSENYVALDGSVRYDESGYARYIEEFFEPAGRAVIDAWRAAPDGGPPPDFEAIVQSVLAD
jgi:hypothetical protein